MLKLIYLSLSCTLLLAVASGCATSLTQKASSIAVTAEDPTNCEFLGYVSATASSMTFMSPAKKSARNRMINSAAEKDADTVYINSQCSGTYSAECAGKAYRCKGVFANNAANDQTRKPSDNTVSQLKELAEMRKNGTLSEEEFQKAKAKLLTK